MTFKKILLILFTGISFYSTISVYAAESSSNVSAVSVIAKELLREIFTNQSYILDITKNLKTTQDFYSETFKHGALDNKEFSEKVALFAKLKHCRSVQLRNNFKLCILEFAILASLTPLGIKGLKLIFTRIHRLYLYFVLKNKLQNLNRDINSLNKIVNFNPYFKKITLKSFLGIIKEYIGNSQQIHNFYNNKIEQTDEDSILLKNQIRDEISYFWTCLSCLIGFRIGKLFVYLDAKKEFTPSAFSPEFFSK